MSNKDSDVVKRAKEFAIKAHAGQFLKNATKDPFIIHPQKVVALVEASGGSLEELAAAWLHDVVEDTSITLDEITDEFGEVIGELVDGLTDPPHFADHPCKIRKAWQAERVISKSDGVKRIKIADQTVNTHMMGFDPPVAWSPDMRLEYVEGAQLIATNCSGVSSKLDGVFRDTYQKVLEAIRADSKQ